MPHSKILVVGSLAFDVIFSIPHDFRQSIPLQEGRIRSFNATYLANQKQEYPGGTAGNIALWLAQKEQPCSIFSAWGRDLLPKGYHEKLTLAEINLRGSEGEFTAHCYSVSDPLHQQLVIWQPNHYDFNQQQHLADFYEIQELKNFEYAVFSAGTPNSILMHMQEFKAQNDTAVVIFDPGQVTPFFTPEEFNACTELCDIIIGNDIEGSHFDTFKPNHWPDHVQRIITLGERGARYHKDGEWHYVDPVPVKEIVETTGAGDAFRAGLVLGLKQGKSLEAALKMGAELGAECVQIPAGQPV